MAYSIGWNKAKDDIRFLEAEIRKRIIKKIRSIENHPFQYVEKLQKYSLYKLRIGDYRAILDIKQKEQQIIVVLIWHRSKVYDKLSRKIK